MLHSAGPLSTSFVSPVFSPRDDCHSTFVQVSSTAASPMLDATFQNSQISSASSSAERISEPKNILQSGECNTTKVDESVPCSDVASSSACSDSVRDLRTEQASSSIKQIEAVNCNVIVTSGHPVTSAASPLTASLEGIMSFTGCLPETAPKEINMALPPEAGIASQENERAGRNYVMRASETIEQFQTPKVDSQMNNLPEAASGGGLIKSVAEGDLIDDGIEDALEGSFIEDPAPEGATSEGDMQTDAQLSHDGPAVEENKLSPSDRMKETFNDLLAQEHRVESNKESPSDKSSPRTSVNTRRKKSTRNLKFDWEEKVIFQFPLDDFCSIL